MRDFRSKPWVKALSILMCQIFVFTQIDFSWAQQGPYVDKPSRAYEDSNYLPLIEQEEMERRQQERMMERREVDHMISEIEHQRQMLDSGLATSQELMNQIESAIEREVSEAANLAAPAAETYTLYDDGMKSFSYAGETFKIEGEKIYSFDGSVAVKNTYNMKYDEKMMIGYEADITDSHGNVSHVRWSGRYTDGSIYYGDSNPESDVEAFKGLAEYRMEVTDALGNVTTTDWKAPEGGYTDKHLRKFTETVTFVGKTDTTYFDYQGRSYSMDLMSEILGPAFEGMSEDDLVSLGVISNIQTVSSNVRTSTTRERIRTEYEGATAIEWEELITSSAAPGVVTRSVTHLDEVVDNKDAGRPDHIVAMTTNEHITGSVEQNEYYWQGHRTDRMSLERIASSLDRPIGQLIGEGLATIRATERSLDYRRTTRTFDRQFNLFEQLTSYKQEVTDHVGRTTLVEWTAGEYDDVSNLLSFEQKVTDFMGAESLSRVQYEVDTFNNVRRSRRDVTSTDRAGIVTEQHTEEVMNTLGQVVSSVVETQNADGTEALDQTTSYYDEFGREAETFRFHVNPDSTTTFDHTVRSYDDLGLVAKELSEIIGQDGIERFIERLFNYDLLGRIGEISSATTRPTLARETPGGVELDYVTSMESRFFGYSDDPNQTDRAVTETVISTQPTLINDENMLSYVSSTDVHHYTYDRDTDQLTFDSIDKDRITANGNEVGTETHAYSYDRYGRLAADRTGGLWKVGDREIDHRALGRLRSFTYDEFARVARQDEEGLWTEAGELVDMQEEGTSTSYIYNNKAQVVTETVTGAYERAGTDIEYLEDGVVTDYEYNQYTGQVDVQYTSGGIMQGGVLHQWTEDGLVPAAADRQEAVRNADEGLAQTIIDAATSQTIIDAVSDFHEPPGGFGRGVAPEQDENVAAPATYSIGGEQTQLAGETSGGQSLTGKTTYFEYNELGQMIGQREVGTWMVGGQLNDFSGAGKYTTFSYNDVGQMLSQHESGVWKIAGTVYDFSSGPGRTTTFSYNNVGQMVGQHESGMWTVGGSVYDYTGMGKTTTFTYSDIGQMISQHESGQWTIAGSLYDFTGV
ncbi:MAG: hypothetical protein JW937_06180, partial [Candidatus Omnitrophica bacterium]|nr:hypothetical protein [Candidatus Omnitrophota bacterium]